MISIIISAHIDTIQKLEWLNQAIESVFRQTFTDWEIILVDDCSGLDITTNYDGDDKLRKVRTSRKSGPALARNTGVALSRGDAILALDADDQLADDNVLELMYAAWQENKDRVIYGDLQRMDDNQKGKSFSLPNYTFEKSLDPSGIIPVTALHSYDCHQKAGGWKNELEAGLEDVEYWISAGKAGCCGQKINVVTLLYRRHDESRSYNLRHVNRRETEMRNRIRTMHRDVYEGRYPMGCCGGSKSSYTGATSNSQPKQQKVTTLDQVSRDQKEWVEYTGARQGSFGVKGQYSGISYKILGTGHKFEVHINDLPRFRRAGRGQDFKIGVRPPDDYVEPEPEPEEAEPYVAFPPPLTEIERYDKIASEELGLEGVQAVEVDMSIFQQDEKHFDLSPLELPDTIREILQNESWTLEMLAEADPVELQGYKGIGPKRSQEIIGKAQELLNK